MAILILRAVLLLVLLVSAAPPAHAALITLETRQRTVATICTGPGCILGTESRVDNSSVNSVTHSNNFDGNLSGSSEARTAGRSGSLEIAANASMRHRTGRAFQDYSEITGYALYEIDLMTLNAGDVYLDFFLPPGFVEIQGNAEFRDRIVFTAQVQADLVFCSPACQVGSDSLFQMFAELQGGWATHTLVSNATSVNPALDTSSLTHDNVTVVTSQPDDFVRIKTWEYDAFSGRLFLGHFGTGQTFTVSYILRGTVFANFPGFETWAAAAINDPFFLSSDPLPQQDLFRFDFVPATSVPEPSTVSVVAVGLCAVLRRMVGVRRRTL